MHETQYTNIPVAIYGKLLTSQALNLKLQGITKDVLIIANSN